MRRIVGRLLAALGLVVGGAMSLALAVPIHVAGISWLIGIGLVKLTFLTSLGLIGAGAVLQRLANRSDARRHLADPRAP